MTETILERNNYRWARHFTWLPKKMNAPENGWIWLGWYWCNELSSNGKWDDVGHRSFGKPKRTSDGGLEFVE